MRLLSVLLVAGALAASACSGDDEGGGQADAAGNPPDAGAVIDAPVGQPDTGPGAVDADVEALDGAAGQIICDQGTFCVATQYCCVVQPGLGMLGSLTCQQTGDPCTGREFTCDGPEDCPGNQHCCSDDEPSGDIGCKATCDAVTVCHSTNDCPAAQPACVEQAEFYRACQ